MIESPRATIGFQDMFLIEETDDLASHVLSPGLLVVHDTGRGSEDNVAELTRWQELDNPLLEVRELDVVAWRDDTSLVETTSKLDHDLAVAVVIDLFELSNVAYCGMCQCICSDNLNVLFQPVYPKTCKNHRRSFQSSEHLKGVGRGGLRPLPSYQPGVLSPCLCPPLALN